MSKATIISRRAIDGKLITATICNLADNGEEKEWAIDFDRCFLWNTRKECEKAARAMVANMVEDYEYDNDLR